MKTVRRLSALENLGKSDRGLFFIILSLIIISYDSYWFGTSGISLYESIRNIFVIALPVILFIYNRQIVTTKKDIAILLFFLFIFACGMMFNGNGFGAPAFILSAFLTGLALVHRYPFKKLALCFSDIISIISLYSLLIELGCLIGVFNLNYLSNIADAPMLSAYGCLFFPELDDSLLRNSAIFREPGVFMIFLNISLLFELFVLNNKYRIHNIIIFSIAMITTFSTGGLICMVLIFVIYNIKSKFGVAHILIITTLIVLFVLLFIGDEYIQMVFGKFDTIDSYGSGFARMSSLVIPIHIFWDYPFFGCGFEQFPEEYVRFGHQLFHREVDPQGMSTNTFMNLFAIWGIFFGAFILYGIYKFSKLISGRKGTTFTVLIFISILLMFSNESMPYWPFLYIFILYGIDRGYKLKTNLSKA